MNTHKPMKQRFFTLLVLIVTLGSMFSIAKAQKVTYVGITPVDGCIRYIDPIVSDPTQVPDSLIMGTYGATQLSIHFSDWDKMQDETIVELQIDGIAAYLGLPDTVIVPKKEIVSGRWDTTIHGGWNFSESMNGGIVSISARIKDSKDQFTPGTKIQGGYSETYALYRPFFSLDYHPVTSLFQGSLIVKFTGIPYTGNELRWIENSISDEKNGTRDSLSKSFSLAQILLLAEDDTIVVRTIHQKTYKYDGSDLSPEADLKYKIPLYDLMHEDENTNRYFIQVEELTNASVNIPNSFHISSPGHYGDLSFTLVMTGNNAGKLPVLKTNRKALSGNGEEMGVTWTREKNADGSYRIAIMKIQEDFTIAFDFEDSTSNSDINQNNSIWVANGRLHITSVNAANAKVFNATGILVKEITLTVGETANISLPAGFYIITLGDNSYKVVK